ncbi:MAG TPA: hypothetical protein VFI91_14545 [Longimicrobiaceae bacterium]|nr:hypothetical protein [Longimicrobiaceae bacterium]
MFRISLGVAVLVHLAILFMFRTELIPTSPFAAAGPDRGDTRAAAGGGSGMQVVNIRVQEDDPAAVIPVPIPVPIPTPVVEAPEVEPEPVREPTPDVAVSAPGTGDPGTGGDSGTAADSGTATGTGAGGGGTEEAGSSGIAPPRPRGMILPPRDPPASARGLEITVWVYVNAQGRVVEDATRLEPPTSDSDYNERLKESAAEWIFEPARENGKAVAAWYPYEIIL